MGLDGWRIMRQCEESATADRKNQPTMTNSKSTVLVTGNTYPVKDQIKALGGRWDAAAKGWRVPADAARAANDLVASASGTGSRPGATRGFRRRNDDDECEICGRNKWTCGHCIGW